MDDYELDFEQECLKCGHSPTRWRDCWKCGGEGGRGWDDLQFEDPLWYSPSDFIACDECNGTGIIEWCSKCGCDINKFTQTITASGHKNK